MPNRDDLCQNCGWMHSEHHAIESYCPNTVGGYNYAKRFFPKISNQKFWMVNGGGDHGSKVRHSSFAEAHTEATRLAKLHPGKAFTILVGVKSITYSALNEITLI